MDKDKVIKKLIEFIKECHATIEFAGTPTGYEWYAFAGDMIEQQNSIIKEVEKVL